MILALIFLCLAIGCYSVSQLQQQRKLKGQKDDMSFWGEKSHLRKYKFLHGGVMLVEENWYTKFAGIEYRERWFTSTNLTSFLTDGYHFAQWMAGNFLSLSLGIALELSWKGFILVWLLIHLLHFLVYKLLSK